MMRSGAVKDVSGRVPRHPRHRLAGVVHEVGEGVTGFEPGDHVMVMTMHTYAELCTVKAADLIKIPDGLEITTAATLPLVNITGDQFIRLGVKVKSGQTVLITGALGRVGRSAVFAASEIGAMVIAGVHSNKLNAAWQLHGVTKANFIDDDAEIDKLGLLDCVADTVGDEIARKLLAKVKPGGTFGCVSSLPQNAALHPSIHTYSVFAKAGAPTTLHYAEALRDGNLTIPIDRIIPPADAAKAQAAAEKGGVAKIVLIV